MIAALVLAAESLATSVPAKVDVVASRANLAGVVLVARGHIVLVEKGYGPITPGGSKRHDPAARWRLASITKQVVATMLMQDVARGHLALDRPLGGPVPNLGVLTFRQLLTHRSGLANPDDTPAGVGGMPAFYAAARPDPDYCLSKPPRPGSPFAYNNCDYIVASTLLQGRTDDRGFWPAGMTLAKDGDQLVPGLVGGKPEPMVRLGNFGAAGGLTGTARAVFNFDRALMTGKLLPAAARAELWRPEGGGSYQALGQWVFPGKLDGCAAPKRIVQRDGEIGGVQTRNYILPDDDLAVVVFTNRSSDDFAFGEIWQVKGFAYDLLSAAACS